MARKASPKPESRDARRTGRRLPIGERQLEAYLMSREILRRVRRASMLHPSVGGGHTETSPH